MRSKSSEPATLYFEGSELYLSSASDVEAILAIASSITFFIFYSPFLYSSCSYITYISYSSHHPQPSQDIFKLTWSTILKSMYYTFALSDQFPCCHSGYIFFVIFFKTLHFFFPFFFFICYTP